MDILTQVEQLEQLAGSGARVPGTRKVLMDLDRVMELVDQMRLGIPKDILEAETILEKREAVINQALLDARRIKASAEEESRTKVDDNEIVRQAEAQAEESLAEAKRRSTALVQDAQRKAHETVQEANSFGETRITEANRYTLEALYNLEEHLSSVLNTVRRGLDSLEEQKETKVA